MKTSLKITVLVFTILFSVQAEAQFFKNLKSKIENKIERKIEEKAERKSDQMIDSVFADKPSRKKKSRKNKETSEPEESQEIGGFDLGEMMEAAMNRKPAEYETSYTFNFTTTMEMTTQNSKPMQMTTSYGDTAYYVEIDKGTTILTDYKNEAMITINEQNKTAQAMSMSLMKMFEDTNQEEEGNSDVSITKTGKSKVIRGYKCDEYILKSNDFTSEGWFTKDVNFDMASHAKSMAEVFKSTINDEFAKKNIGFPIEMTSITHKNEVMTMKILDISNTTKTVDLSDYKVTQL